MLVVAATDVEDDYLDSTDHIAYQYSNLIQPHVLFFNVDLKSRVILNASTNVNDWLGIDPHDVVGQVLGDDLFPGISDALQATVGQSDFTARVFDEVVSDREGRWLLCRVVSTPATWLVELEFKQHPSSVEFDSRLLESLLLETTRSLTLDSSVEELVNDAVDNLRRLLGFERGMCYRFDDENNGEVIAESTVCKENLKYLGLRFPSRDIPRTAREMLLASPLRTTLDQRADCCQIFPSLAAHTQQYVDLTHVRGRGAAGSCREYYLNLNIRSTLVLPLIVENSLWGLLSFHHQEARYVDPRWDDYLQAIAKCLSVSLERNIRATREQARTRGSQVVLNLSEVNPISDHWLNYIQLQTNHLKELIPCDGFILRISGELLTAGTVPDVADRQYLVDKAWELSHGDALITNCLDDVCHDLGSLHQLAAGMIAIPLSVSHNDIAIWLRPEQKQTIRWAGDPHASMKIDSNGRNRLCVRESFDVWNRVTEKRCLPWSEQDRCIATSAAMQVGLLALGWHAAQASQAKSQFLSCMSHEIRTPMTAILGYAQLLKEQLQSAMQTSQSSDFIEVIERNGMHLLSVIDDILNLAKIEAGKLTVEQIPIRTSDLLADVVALMRVQADSKQLRFTLKLETPIPKLIFGDAVRLRQILINLIGNAIKFTMQGEVNLNVSYNASTRSMNFDVVDTGIGLTDSQVSRLFNAFSQADKSTTRRFGGSGLGLTISKHLAQLLGGDITVQSQPGVGSTFSVSIDSGCPEPVELITNICTGSESPELNASSDSKSRSPLPRLEEVRILLLEDGEDNQRLLRHLLKSAGAEVTVYENGKLGIESLTTDGHLESELRTPFPFDIVLTDMQMPEMDGYATVRMLRQKGCTQPIIALTAFAMQGNDEDCIAAGCDDYLSKPLTRESLLNVCAKWKPIA